MKIARWENPGIKIYYIPEICQPARKSQGIDFSENKSLGAPAYTMYTLLDIYHHPSHFSSQFVSPIVHHIAKKITILLPYCRRIVTILSTYCDNVVHNIVSF